MSNLYRAYSAVHNSEVSTQLNESRDIISDMEFTYMNSADLQEVAEEIIEEMFHNTLTIEQSKEIIKQIISEALNGEKSELRSSKVEYIEESFNRAFYNCHTEERFSTYRHSKKVQENFHNISNEDLGNKRLHEALIAQEKKTIKEGILSLIEKKTKDSSYLETNIKNIEENNEKARKDMENMGTTMKSPQLEEFSQIRQDWSSAYSSIYEEKCEECDKDPCNCDIKEGTSTKKKVKAKSAGQELEKMEKDDDAFGAPNATTEEWKSDEVQQVDEIVAPAVAGPAVAGTLGAVTGKKGRKVKKALGAGTGAAVGGALGGPLGALGGPLGAVAGGLVGGALSDEVQHKGVTFSETELKKFEEIVKSWVD